MEECPLSGRGSAVSICELVPSTTSLAGVKIEIIQDLSKEWKLRQEYVKFEVDIEIGSEILLEISGFFDIKVYSFFV